ncbi:hypothetical protein NU219Hw_g7799t1 [Hortaea werneckii]
MPDAAPSPSLNSLQQTRQAQLTTALTHRTTAQAHLATASTVFCTADEANIAALTRLLDFKAGGQPPPPPPPPPNPSPSNSSKSKGKSRATADGSSWVNGEGTEGMTATQIKRFQALKRAQRSAQRAFGMAAVEVVQAQEEVARAGMRVRRARRALEELEV